MKKLLIAIAGLTLALSTKGILAEETDTPNLRVSDGTVEVEIDENEWMSIGSLEEVKQVLFPEESSGVQIGEDGELIINGENTGYYLSKKEDTETTKGETTYTVSISFITDEGTVVASEELELANGTYEDKVNVPEGYTTITPNKFTVKDKDLSKVIMVEPTEEVEEPEETAEPKETAEPTEEPEETAEPKETTEPTEESEETVEPEETAEPTEAPEENDETTYAVKITYINYEDGAVVGEDELSLANGEYEDTLEAPEGYVLMSKNELIVADGELNKLMIVKPGEKDETDSEETEEDSEPTYEVTLNFVDSQGELFSSRVVQLKEGTYSTLITDYMGQEKTILAPKGYIVSYPTTIKVENQNASVDLLIHEGDTCGKHAEMNDDGVCVAIKGYTGNPYDADPKKQ